MLYKSTNPYPKVRVEEKNSTYASILLGDYAGVVSEDTAIHLYLFQAIVNDSKVEEYSNIMYKIAQVEMIHMRLLGETISLLGGVPVFGTIGQDEIIRLWNAGNVNYDISLKQMIEADIESENVAIRNYQYQLAIIKDKYIQKLIERILEDEKIHLQIFKDLYQKYFVL